ncbi:MAG: hypothetical protein MUC69_00870 [Gemmatimonadales bacterium]|nr:hypothetical protein [Gemmatimonadales bacterium]
MCLYLDGALQGSCATGASAGGALTADLRAVGSDRVWKVSGSPFVEREALGGVVDDVRIYRTRLTATDLATLYQQGIGARPGPCGDGALNQGEQCDEGTANGAAGSCCTTGCALVPFCHPSWCGTIVDTPGTVSGATATYFTQPAWVPAREAACRLGEHYEGVTDRLYAVVHSGGLYDDRPVTLDVAGLTGLGTGATAWERARWQRGPLDQAGHPVMQLLGDEIGLYVAGPPPVYGWSTVPVAVAHDFANGPYPWATPGRELAFQFGMKLPHATAGAGSAAYAAAVLRFRNPGLNCEAPGNMYFWLSVYTYWANGFGGSFGDSVVDCDCLGGGSMDGIAQTRLAPYDDQAPGIQKFGHLGPGSDGYQYAPWASLKSFDFRINAAEMTTVLQAIRDYYYFKGKTLCGDRFVTDPAQQQLVHFNVNPETFVPPGTSASLGVTVKDIRIAQFADTRP